MDPKEAKYPKNRLKNVRILYGDENTSFSIACVNWDGEDRCAIRWNYTEESDKGFPVSRWRNQTRGSWFIMPKEIIMAYAKEKGSILDIEIIKKIER